MVRLLHTADWHLGKRLGRFERLAEQQHALESLLQHADTEHVDAILVAGDVFDSANPSTEALKLFHTALCELSRGGERPVIVIAGNHDSPERLEAAATWGYALGILLLGFPDTALPPAGTPLGKAVIRSSVPGMLELEHPRWAHPLRLLPLPYVSAYRLSHDLPVPLPEWLRRRWEAALQHRRTAAPTLVIAHLYCQAPDGTAPEEGEDEKPVALGGLDPLPTQIFPETVHYVALGHIHRPMTLQAEHPPVVYAGSLLPYTFTDTMPEKSAVLLELSPQGVLSSTRLPLRGSLPLRRLCCQSVEGALQALARYPEAYVQLELSCDHALAVEDLQRLHQAHRYLVELRLVPRVPLPSASQANSLDPLRMDIEELFLTFFRTRTGVDPDPALRQLFREVLREHHSET
ncbi:Nuclease SbcCD subunit D [bacterium HR21]|nr:Nuclease SbcCD subunit D [bacterium HR21]